MPTLRNITCQLLWPEKTPFKEVATTYGDGIVETYIPIPANKPQKFSIRVRSKGYIYEGLAVVVFVDGVYQLNRNRVNLARPKKGQPAGRTEIDFMLRQEEKQLDRRQYFLGSDWRFDDFRTVPDAAVVDAGDDCFEGLGTIDVIIMRCCPSPDDIQLDDYDEGAESDVLGNNLTEDDFAAPEVQESAAGKGGKEGGKTAKEGGNAAKQEESVKPDKAGKGGKSGKTKDAAPGPAKNEKAENSKGAKPASANKDKPKSATVSDDDDDSNDDKLKQKQTQKQKPKPTPVPEDDDDDSDEDKLRPNPKQKGKPKGKLAATSDDESDSDDGNGNGVPGVDGPADDFYRGNRFYHYPHWPGRPQTDRYGYHGMTSNAPTAPHPHEKHVHWDMGPGHAGPHETRYSDRADVPYVRTPYTPDLSQHADHSHQPPYAYGSIPHYQHQPPPYNAYHGSGEPYYGNQGPLPRPPGYGPLPHHGPLPSQGYASGYAPQPVPQAGYGIHNQQRPACFDNVGQQGQNSNSNHQPLRQEGGGWKYVEPSRSVVNPPTIDKFNGWEYVNNTWVLAKDPQSKTEASPANGTTTFDANPQNDAWNSNNGGQDNTASGNSDAQDWNKEWTEPKNSAGDDNADKSQDDSTKNPWDDDNNQDNTGNGDASNDNAQFSGDGGWGGTSNNDTGNNDNTANDSSWGAAPGSPSAGSSGKGHRRTLHGPLGAYQGPKIAVEPYGSVPWIADEPPCYDIPESVVKKLGISKQVQRGKGYNYYKKHRKPIYIDSISEPYARFVFKYRTRDKLPGGLDKEAGLEPTPDATIQSLQEKNKDDLIAELQRWRMAYGDEAPQPKTKRTKKPKKEPDDAAWNLDMPMRDFLKYRLPGQFPESSNGAKKAAQNTKHNGDGWTNGSGSGNNGWDNSNTSGSNGWDSSNANGNAGDAQKASTNTIPRDFQYANVSNSQAMGGSGWPPSPSDPEGEHRQYADATWPGQVMMWTTPFRWPGPQAEGAGASGSGGDHGSWPHSRR